MKKKSCFDLVRGSKLYFFLIVVIMALIVWRFGERMEGPLWLKIIVVYGVLWLMMLFPMAVLCEVRCLLCRLICHHDPRTPVPKPAASAPKPKPAEPKKPASAGEGKKP